MPQNLRDDIRSCYEHAHECARKAEEAVSSEERLIYLQMAKNWLDLAKDYERDKGK